MKPETNLAFLSGLYTRVAKQVGVHPSYVSRVARGERRSEKISRAIAVELAQFMPADSEDMANKADPAGASELRRRLIRKLKSNPQLLKMSATVIELDQWPRSRQAPRVSRFNLQGRFEDNALMIAESVEQFQRLSRRLERFDHVLSLTDGEGVVLYSFGTTGAIWQQGRLPGSNWSKDLIGPSAAARAIASGVPLVIVGPYDHDENPLTVRMACPIRLSDRQIAGVVVLTIVPSRARPEELVDLCKIAKKICSLLDRHRKNPEKSSTRSSARRVQPFEEAEMNLARVMTMPEIDHHTRTYLASVLAELESKRREVMLEGDRPKNTRRGHAKAHSV